MEVADLSPKLPKPLTEVEGGSYHFWSSSELAGAGVGAGKLSLQPLGFAFPHYGDSAKIGYVTQGKGMAGIILSGSQEEKIVLLEKGTAIAVPLGCVSWWYNDDTSSVLTVVFLGDTSTAITAGEFTYFLLAGSIGIFSGFSPEFAAKAWDVDEASTTTLFKNQPALFITKLEEKMDGLKPRKTDAKGLVLSCSDDEVVVIGERNLGGLKGMGVCGNVVRVEEGAMWSPAYFGDAAAQVVYVVRGRGRVEMVDSGGKRAVEGRVEEGYLMVVPKFFVVSVIADEGGMEWFSLITTSRYEPSQMTGKSSLLKVLSPKVVEVALNVSSDSVKLLRSKRSKDDVLLPPSK